jgi:protein SCO1/2
MERAESVRPRVIIVSCCIALTLGLVGCGSLWASSGKRYDLQGKVVAVDPTAREVTVAHQDIKGYMPGMVMPFSLKDDAMLNLLKPGDEIKATLVVDGPSIWLEKVAVTKEAEGGADSAPTEGAGEPKIGDQVPDFALLNQDNKRIHLRQYSGKIVVLTFIYTRCPIPEYCTLMSNNFSELDGELSKDQKLYGQTHLLSVSFDPEYDTPKVLRSYGAAHTGNYDKETFAHWEFASGTPDQVKAMAEFFGLRYFPESDQIVHSLRTAVITADGKLFKIYRGNDWKPAELMTDVYSIVGH